MPLFSMCGVSNELYETHVANGIGNSVTAKGMHSMYKSASLTPAQELAIEVIESAYSELVFRLEAVGAANHGEDLYGLYQLFPASKATRSYATCVGNVHSRDRGINSAIGCDSYRWSKGNEPWNEDYLYRNEDSPLLFFTESGFPRFSFWFGSLESSDSSHDKITGEWFVEQAEKEAETWMESHYTATRRRRLGG